MNLYEFFNHKSYKTKVSNWLSLIQLEQHDVIDHTCSQKQ